MESQQLIIKQLLTPNKNLPSSDQTSRLQTNFTPQTSPQTSLGLTGSPWNSPDISQNSPRRSLPSSSSYPPAKRIKIEEKPTDQISLRKAVLQWKKSKVEILKESYNNHIAEVFFLENDGNIMDLQIWMKHPTQEYMQYARQHRLQGDDTLEKRLAQMNSQAIQSPVMQIKSEFPPTPPTLKSNMNVNSSPVKNNTSPRQTLKNSPNLSNIKQSNSPTPGNNDNPSQDQMVEKARQEAHVMSRISALRKEGLWSEKRLPKVQEPPRPKAHWDYLLEEMVWLSADFAQERKWKKAAAKKCAKMVQKYFQDKEIQAQKAEKDQEVRLRKIASFQAKEIRTFWSNVEKLLEYKVNTRLDEKKKKALDQQLSFIVDQTEKYSSWLAESMKKPGPSTPGVSDSAAPSVHSDTLSQGSRMSDGK